MVETKGQCCTSAALLQQDDGAEGGGDDNKDDGGSAARFGVVVAPEGTESVLAMLMILEPPAGPPATGRAVTNHVAIQLLQVHWV